jgi:putative addiction module component (TIGR02574 family)
MADQVPLPPPGFDDLPVEQQIDYVEALWDRIAALPEGIPTPDWHLEIIEQRLANPQEPAETSSWEELRDGLLAKLRERRPLR